MRISLIPMAWDDRRRTYRMPAPEPRLSVPQHYFRIGLTVLGVIGLVALVLLAVLIGYAVTGR